ncbi:MAG: hypothetical protein IJ803_05805 [Oribacterium sp.]|nr:hypothetical protein [Oribacterium sp.]
MLYLKITTIGEVAFENHMKLEEGYRYDIPFDNLMLPYIPIADILKNEGMIPKDVKIGFAHPDGYQGLCLMVSELIKNRPNIVGLIKKQFTNDRAENEGGMRIRSIKPGKRFFARMLIPQDQQDELEKIISGRKRIGITSPGITGEVMLQLVDDIHILNEEYELSPLAHYASLDYTVTLLSPACFYAPYEDGKKTYLHIPGAVISEFVHRHVTNDDTGESENIRCTNAYITDGAKRLLPVPSCVSVVKLDKRQLRYRLAPGKDPRRTEQDLGLSHAFASDFESNLIKYTTPLTEHIALTNGEMFDALSPGQTFSGRIYGSDHMIRRIAGHIKHNPYAFMGKLTEEGYGEAVLSVTGADEEEIPAELPAKIFDVCCVSDTLLLNDDGVPSYKAEDLLKEIEYVLNCPGRLMIEGCYTYIYSDYSENPGWGKDGAVVRCMGKGSVLRIRTTDGEPIDIFPIMSCFVGERTEYGYGELLSYPARGKYYRLAEKMPVSLYDRKHLLSFRDISMGADFAREVIRSALKSRIQALAMTDSREAEDGVLTEDLIPQELFSAMKEMLMPDTPEELMKTWYLEALEGK